MHALSCGTKRGARTHRACERAVGWGVVRLWASITSQKVGSLPVVFLRRFAQRDTSACLAPGASSSSRHEWLRKAVTSPIAAGTVRARSVGPVGGAVVLSTRSTACSWLAGRQRRSFEARSSAASGSLPPTSAATAAAFSASVPRPAPRRPRRRWMRPRLRGVTRAAHRRRAMLKSAMRNPAMSTPKPRSKRRPTAHIRRKAGRGCMARSPRQRSVVASAPALAKSSAASGKPNAPDQTPASVPTRMSAPIPVHTTTAVAHTTRIARASVGKRARRRRQRPSGAGTSHHMREPTAASIGSPAEYIIEGVEQITNSAHPTCPIAKLTRSRRPSADARAARNTPLTAAELAAPEGVLSAAAVADREGEVAAPWPLTLDSASAPRRSRRQPARPKSSRVGSRAIATTAAKAISVRCLRSRWL
eukprot:scaffold2058_cov69-Phaeocystis_antarctica.AAC.4